MRETWQPDEGEAPAEVARGTAVPDPAESPAAEPGEAPPPRYTIGGSLGSGGMGEVFTAHDRTLRRDIAVKVLRRAGPAARDRFAAEAQVTAQLDHPNIVPVHDLGTLADGRPFLAMKQVRGASLREWLDRAPRPDLEARLDVLRRVCDAIAFAHAQGVLHRDLKPENVMVGAFGEVLVMDWGLARPITPTGATDAGPLQVDRFEPGARRTQEGGVAGTPAYMAPEQAAGKLAELDTRSDVYALGAILYELLTDHPPFEGSTEEVLAAVCAGRFLPPRRRAAGVPRELDAVVLRAMALRKADRYPSAEALREDLDAFIARRPLRHVQSSLGERVAKWAARHRGAVRTGGAVSLAAAVALLVGGWRYSVDVGAARDRAVVEAERAREAEAEARTGLGRAQLALADALAAERRFGEARRALSLAAEALPAEGPDARARTLAESVLATDSPLPVSTCQPHGQGLVVALTIRADGTRAASWGRNGTLVEWDPATCAVLATTPLAGEGGAGALRYDGSRLRGLVVGDDRLTLIDGEKRALYAPPAAIGAVGVNADGLAWLVTSEGQGFTVEEGGLRPAGGPQADGAIWYPDGGVRVATSIRTGGELGGAWRPDGRALWTSPGVSWADASEAGTALLVASNSGPRLVDLTRGRVIWEVASGPLARIGIAPGGGYGWTSSYDGAIDVLDLETGVALVRFDADAGLAATVVATTPGARVVAVATGPTVSTWLRPLRPARRIGAGLEAGAQGLAVSADGRLAAAADERGRVVVADIATGALLRGWQLTEGVRGLAFSPDGGTLAAAPRQEALVLLDVSTGAERRIPMPWRVSAVGWQPGVSLVAAGRTGAVATVTPATGEVTAPIQAVPGAIWHVTPLPDGRVLVGSHGAAGKNPVSVVDPTTGRVSVLLDGAPSRYRHAVSPDGALVAVGQQDGLVPLVELATGRVRATLHADDGPTMGVAFSSDGRTLATTGFGGRVVLWDVPSATRLRAVDQHGGIGANVVFTPDGSTLLSVGESGDVGVLRLDLPARLAAARARLVGAGGNRGAAFAALGWWERALTEADVAPEVAASARLALQGSR